MSATSVGKVVRSFCTGDCDVMALALNRLTGKPFGLWAGVFKDEDGEDVHEYAHACVILGSYGGDKVVWLDVNGIHAGVPDNLHFNNPVSKVELIEAEE